MKIQFKLMLVIVPVLIVIFGVTTITTNIISTAALENQAKENANLLSNSYSNQIDSTLNLYFNIAQDLGSAVVTSIHVETTLKEFRKRYPQFVNVFYTPENGRILESVPYKQEHIGFDIKKIAGWRQAFEKKSAVISRPGEYFGVKSVILFAPALLTYIINQEPTVVGMTAMVLPLNELFKGIESVRVGKAGNVFVIDDKGVFLHYENKIQILNIKLNILSENQTLDQIMQAMIDQKTGFATYTDQTDRKYVSFAPISAVNWSLGVTGSYQEISAGVYKIILVNLIVVLLGAILGIIVLYFVVHSVLSPIGKLTKMAQKIEKGDYSHQLSAEEHIAGKQNNDEISKLIIAFYKMASELDNTFISLHKEIHEREAAEVSLKAAQSYIINIVDSMPSALIGVDENYIITHWNKAAENTSNINRVKAVGQKISVILPELEPYLEKVTDSIESQTMVVEQKRSRKTEGNSKFEDISIYPLVSGNIQGAVIRIDDVTDKMRMEEMMIQSEKMLSVGGLAAGMAHEINNPLAGVIQSADVVQRRLTDQGILANKKVASEIGIDFSDIRAYLEKRDIVRMIKGIKESGTRISEIISNMLSFARKSETQISSYDISILMEKTIELAATDIHLKREYEFKKIRIEKEYESGLPLVPCESSKIQQVILNILMNGAQEMQAAGIKDPGFKIKIYTDSTNKMVCVDIIDNGPGMEESTLKRVFEPFYTTKPVGVGTGLGLSVSYFIITNNHGGEMSSESTPGEGAKFSFRLPIEGKNI